jgi:hypothetical protein
MHAPATPPVLDAVALDALVLRAAQDTLDLTNRPAWSAMLRLLLEAGLSDADAQIIRNRVWVQRKRLRLQAQIERLGASDPPAPAGPQQGT